MIFKCSFIVNAFIASAFFVCAFYAVAQTNSGTVECRIADEEAMRRAYDYFQQRYSPCNEGWERSTYQAGNFRAWQTLGVPACLDLRKRMPSRCASLPGGMTPRPFYDEAPMAIFSNE